MRKTRTRGSSPQLTAVGNGRKRQRQGSQRELRFAQGFLAGKTKVQAARDAGYSESTALKKSWKFIERPHLQSIVTEALENLGVTPEKIVQPLLDGLKANIVVKHSETQAAKVTDLPDLEMRLRTVDRIVSLYGLGAKHGDRAPDEPPEPPRPEACNIVFVPPKHRDPEPAIPEVTFVPPAPR